MFVEVASLSAREHTKVVLCQCMREMFVVDLMHEAPVLCHTLDGDGNGGSQRESWWAAFFGCKVVPRLWHLQLPLRGSVASASRGPSYGPHRGSAGLGNGWAFISGFGFGALPTVVDLMCLSFHAVTRRIRTPCRRSGLIVRNFQADWYVFVGSHLAMFLFLSVLRLRLIRALAAGI